MTISVHDSFDFKDGADSSNEYLYDANGNMIQDKNKGIAQIQYNHLNMPTRITYDNGNMIDYLYSASGVKLEVTHTTNKLLMVNSNIGNSAAAKASLKTTDLLTIDEPALAGRTRIQATAASNLEVQTTDYINGYILSDGTLSQIQMNGGYMTEDANGKAVYHFYLQDHQGNNRVVVNGSTLAVEQVNHYYPYGGLFAESTGGEKQAFKYNGKELDRMCGLNWYDHGARHNDAAIGRWHCIDPLAEKYYSISPYVYCADNPVNLIDPDGRAYYDVSKDGTITMRQDEHINDKTDFLFVKGNPKQEPLEITDRGILSGLINIKNSKKYDDGSRKIWTSTNSSEESLNVFTFLADNTEIEWSMSKFNNGQVAIGAILEKEHKGPIEGNAPNDFTEVQKTENEILHVHSHPCTPGPSGAYNDN